MQARTSRANTTELTLFTRVAVGNYHYSLSNSSERNTFLMADALVALLRGTSAYFVAYSIRYSSIFIWYKAIDGKYNRSY